jgi:hypothetical protein
MKQHRSTIAPLHDKLVEHIKVGRAFGASASALAASFAAAHGLHENSVLRYAVQHGLLSKGGNDQSLLKALEFHLKAGGEQLAFARIAGIGKDRVCRLSRQLGWSCRLVSGPEWELLQQLRRGEARK